MIEKRIAKVLAFAYEKHKGQVDKSGVDYILHPITVSLYCVSDSAKIVALLHDVLEDTDATIDDIVKLDLTKEEIEAIKLLTKPRKEDYMHYVKRVAENPIAREVKMCDLQHNMDISRLKHITEKDMQRVERYKQAYHYLSEVNNRNVLDER
jgi:(p)ppGpp synthase/HD superfamily hydrolase